MGDVGGGLALAVQHTVPLVPYLYTPYTHPPCPHRPPRGQPTILSPVQARHLPSPYEPGVQGGPGRGAVGRGIPIYPQVPSLPSCYGGYPLGGGPRYGWYYRVLYMYMLTGINSSWNIIILSMVVDFYIYMYMVFPV